MADFLKPQFATCVLVCGWGHRLRDADVLGLDFVFGGSNRWLSRDDLGTRWYDLGNVEAQMLKGFRPAKPASFAWNYSKTLMQTVCFWVVFLYLLPWLLLKIQFAIGLPTFPPKQFAAATIFVVGAVLGLGSSVVMARLGEGTPLPPDCPRKLVVRGPYAYVRNPMAIGGILQGIAVGIGLGSWLVIGYSLLGIPVWHCFARPSEEADMRERFGEEFQSYEQNVRLWFPRLTAYRD